MTRNIWIWINLVRRPKETEADSICFMTVSFKIIPFLLYFPIFLIQKGNTYMKSWF